MAVSENITTLPESTQTNTSLKKRKMQQDKQHKPFPLSYLSKWSINSHTGKKKKKKKGRKALAHQIQMTGNVN